MKNIYVQGSFKTPEIKFEKNGQMSIKGVSMGENIDIFYKSAFDWLTSFAQTEEKSINLVLYFEYLNTPSTILIVNFLKEINHLKKNGLSVNIVWQYEDDDESILELGVDVEISSNSKFIFEAIKAD